MPSVPQLRRRARRAAAGIIRRTAGRFGLEVVRADFYSPLPEVPAPGDPVWSHRLPMDLDLDAQLAFLEGTLAPFYAELPAGLAPAAANGFTTWNGQYQAGDAETLYAMIRHLRPARILELGSGWSTLVSAAACVANRRDGVDTTFVAVDPSPRTTVPTDLDGLTAIDRMDCRKLPLDRFTELAAGDLLFIDTSHIVKLGSEVVWLVLEVLPTLAPGVHVHFHDVFLPHEYPRYLFDQEVFFNEQYLLHAFLHGNDAWELTVSLCALYRAHRQRLAALMPSLAEDSPDRRYSDISPAAFWMRRR